MNVYEPDPAERPENWRDLWNWCIDPDELCTVCDGKPAPDPECDWCHGTGKDEELIAALAAPYPRTASTVPHLSTVPSIESDLGQTKALVWLLERAVPSSGVKCERCGHGADDHRLDDHLNYNVTDPAAPFRCVWPMPRGPVVRACFCPNFIAPPAPPEEPAP